MHKNIFKGALYFIVVVLVAVGLSSKNTGTVRIGLVMLYNGECSNLSGVMWSWVGLENPVCRHYHRILNLMTKIILGDPEAFAMFSALVSLGIAGPVLFANRIDALASQIEDRMK